MLGKEAEATEATEAGEAMARVECVNLARMSALYRRHVGEAEALAARAAETDRVLLQAHLAVAQRLLLLPSGVRRGNVAAARAEMAAHVAASERGAAKDARDIARQSDAAFASVAEVLP